jgi:hypothetical protein
MDHFLIAYFALSVAIGLVAAFIEGGLYGAEPVTVGLVSAAVWPGVILILIIGGPFWMAGRAGEWFQDWRSRTPQNASQVPGIDPNPTTRDEGER